MTAEQGFEGFNKKTLTFFQQLAKNNNKEWFDAHKADFEANVMTPARAFVSAMGAKLKAIAPKINADPRVNKSLFRLNRDTRFSKDKTPYKTHLGIWLWEGESKRMDSSGFYFHLEPPNIMLGVGMHCLPKEMIPAFRNAIVDPKKGPALAKALATVSKNPLYQMQTPRYKKVPRGYDPEHKLADLLKYDGMTLSFSAKVPEEFFGPGLVDWCYPHYKEMAPLHRWMRDMAAAAQQ